MVSANEIPPGQEGQITVNVKSGSNRRQLRQAVKVQTNVPGKEHLTLRVTANVLTDLEVLRPGILRFDNRQSLPQVTVKNFTDTPIEITNLVPPNEYLTLTVSEDIIPPQGEVFVNAKVSSDAPDGVISEWAKLHTNLVSQPVIQIRVWANLQKEQTP